MGTVNPFSFKLHVNVWTFLFAAFLLFAGVPVLAQHDMSNMPGMSKPKPKSKSKSTTRKTAKKARKKQTAKQHDMTNMPGMSKPKAKSKSKVTTPKKRRATRKKQTAKKQTAKERRTPRRPSK